MKPAKTKQDQPVPNSDDPRPGPSQAALDRATRLAGSLFEDAVAPATAAQGGHTWRSVCRPAQFTADGEALSAKDIAGELRDDVRPAAVFFAAEPIVAIEEALVALAPCAVAG